MKSGWVTKALGEICGFVRGPFGGSLKKETFVEDGFAVYEQQHAIYAQFENIRYFIDNVKFKEMQRFELHPNDLIMSCSGTMGRVAIVPDNIRPGIINQALLKLTPSKAVLPEFLKCWMNSTDFQDRLKEQSGGAAIQNVASVCILKEIKMPLPSLSEQQRIVSILDEAFEGIATARANAEKNLQNARALFESHLHSEHADKAFLGDLVNIRTGKLDANAAVEGGQYPFFTCSREIYAIDEYAFDCEAILLAGNNAVGDFNVKHYNGKFNAYQRTYVITVNEKKLVLYRFLYFQMLKSLKKFKAQSVGTGTKFLKLEMIKGLKIELPSLDEQHRFVSAMDSVREETQHLESIYQQKLTALEELKRSLLHQAFTGQLTTSSVMVPESAAQQFPVEVEGISTTDLHAGILAMAYDLHEKDGKIQYFGHVKAEKIAHMVEAKLGILLGRNPVKDAAGPNDFKHLIGVEHRARMAKYFDFKEVQKGRHELRKLGGFTRLIDKTRTALGSRLADVEHLLAWMLPMNMQQAEIVATVFAAWNNLLLDGKHPTDEEIVYEARENWHPAKLKIVRDKFFAAVQWMREQKVIPEGKGPRVDKKGK